MNSLEESEDFLEALGLSSPKTFALRYLWEL